MTVAVRAARNKWPRAGRGRVWSVGLVDRAKDRVDDFSSDMRRRVNIAMALMYAAFGREGIFHATAHMVNLDGAERVRRPAKTSTNRSAGLSIPFSSTTCFRPPGWFLLLTNFLYRFNN